MVFWDDRRSGNPLEVLKREYNAERVRTGIEYARRDIARIQEFLRHAEARLAELDDQEYRDVVELRRQTNYATKRVEYFVTVRRDPVIDGKPSRGAAFYPGDERPMHFTGRERKKAIECAKELSAAHGGCPIESDVKIPGASK